MSKWIVTASVLGGLAAAVPAQAMPFSALSDAQPGVTLIAQGCGPGWFRNPWGRCVPMGAPAPYYRPYPYAYGPRPYPYARPYPYGPHCWWRNGVRVCR
ncbi:hypothetical protein DFR50_11735 [Roseiarcus fermentans]|uniref:PXPV repeat-containing protein n=1 Tax=Roseiarcus fermentans TaxID=1473586 RepID=A0A366FB12_9HYPH|nr:hypothetical protein [Roseiarcus fermentans]RBP11150.1 hypothetical protein DFR50_11735 [Roseiarcus fermentans]